MSLLTFTCMPLNIYLHHFIQNNWKTLGNYVDSKFDNTRQARRVTRERLTREIAMSIQKERASPVLFQ